MKYTVLMSCGHNDIIDLGGKTRDRERKIEYLKYCGVCKECYKKKMQEQAESEGLIFNASVLPRINQETGDIAICVWFSGNTKPYKDAIKSLDWYRWSERDNSDDIFGTEKSQLCWNKIIYWSDLEREIEKAKSIGAKTLVSLDGLAAEISFQIALDKQNKWKERQNKIKNINKPIIPDILKDCKWNQKIYGKENNYSIYLDGEKVIITDEQADEIESYLRAKEEYKKKVEEIKNA